MPHTLSDRVLESTATLACIRKMPHILIYVLEMISLCNFSLSKKFKCDMEIKAIHNALVGFPYLIPNSDDRGY